MRDIKITSDGDLEIINGDIVLVEGAEEVAQAVALNLRTLQGEWILDPGIGVPWFEKIMNVATPDDEKELIIRREILSVSGVKNISTFDFEVDYINRSLSIDCRILTDYSEEEIEVST